MPKLNAHDLIDGNLKLPSLPDIYFQVSRMINDPRFSLEDVSQVILKDPALSARLLKLVNSSFYGFQSRIDTISRAIVVIGIDELKNLILVTSVIDSFQNIPTDLVNMTDFWMRSIRCALLARCLAKKSFFLHSERLFVAGLLHDIGSLVLYLKFPQQSALVLKQAANERQILPSLQQDIIGVDYTQTGSALIQSWQLPESLVTAVACQLQPERALAHNLEATLLAVTVSLINGLEQGRPITKLVNSLMINWLIQLKISPEDIINASEQADSEFEQIFELVASHKKIY